MGSSDSESPAASRRGVVPVLVLMLMAGCSLASRLGAQLAARDEPPAPVVVQAMAPVRVPEEDTATISGVVSRRDGAPVAGATVELHAPLTLRAARPGEPRPLQVTRTDEQGRYAFEHVAEPSVLVAVIADGFANRTERSTDFRRGDRQLDIALEPGLSISGQVVDRDGAPLAGAVIASSPASGSGGAMPPIERGSITVSDDTGHFVLEGLGNGAFVVHCSADGHSPQLVNILHARGRDIAVVMERLCVAGGSVTDPAGAPVSVFSLHLMSAPPGGMGAASGGEPRHLHVSREVEHPEGRFSFDGLEPGTYLLEARAEGLADTRSAEFTVVRDAEQPPQVSLRMRRGGTLSGRVQDRDGTPLAAALVTLNPNHFMDSIIARIFKSLAPTGERERTVRTGPDGSWRLENIPPGTWQLVGEHESAASRVLDDVLVVDEDAGSAAPVDLILPRGAAISGRVVDDTGAPKASWVVMISTVAPSFMLQRTKTDNEGGFRFENLREGTYVVEVPLNLPVPPTRVLCIGPTPTHEVEVAVREGETVDSVVMRARED